MDILNVIENWSKKDIYIEYMIVDQFANGYGEQVKDGIIPPITYSVFITNNKTGEDLFHESFDSLSDGFEKALVFLNKNY